MSPNGSFVRLSIDESLGAFCVCLAFAVSAAEVRAAPTFLKDYSYLIVKEKFDEENF